MYEILIFGQAALAAGRPRVCVEVASAESGIEAEALLRALGEQHPELRFAILGARLAVNSAFAAPEELVRAGDEVALVSLLGGG